VLAFNVTPSSGLAENPGHSPAFVARDHECSHIVRRDLRRMATELGDAPWGDQGEVGRNVQSIWMRGGESPASPVLPGV
jgi:hypothetical protein